MSDRKWHSVQANLMEAVKLADTWREVVRATDAFFHARMIFENTFVDTQREDGRGKS